LSTDEKFGEALEPLDALLLGEELAPPEALELLGDALEPLELLGDALELLGEALELPELLGEALELLGEALEPLEPDAPLLAPVEPELCATATLASAKSAAAVAVLTTFNIGIPPRRLGRTAAAKMQ
jgi:hypothetical protein